MKRITIIEDEPMAAEFLVKSINWAGIGVEVAGSYDNGRDGLAGILDTGPDVVITDINMPEMDGITMIQQAVSQNVKCAFIVLSGYDDFHLVKDAFKLGVTDYFLKAELEPEELIKAVQKIICNPVRDFVLTPDKNLLVKETRIREFIWGVRDIGNVEFGLRIRESNFAVLMIRFLNYSEILSRQWEDDSELLKYGIMNLTEELLAGKEMGEFFLDSGSIIILISDGRVQNSESLMETAAGFLRQNLEKAFGFRTCAGYCGFEDRIKKLKPLYEFAKRAVDYTFIVGREKTVNYREIPQAPLPDQNRLTAAFAEQCAKFDFNGILARFAEYAVTQCAAGQAEQLMQLYDFYFTELLHASAKMAWVRFDRRRHKAIMDSGTLTELIQYLREMLTELRDASGDDGALVPKVRKYIEDNYHKNISMESVARIFGVGYQKLSREFSKKTNESFKKYLIKVRMENAMDMILHTEYLLYEIAQMVGYANYENFSRMFYSYFKIWPKDIERH